MKKSLPPGVAIGALVVAAVLAIGGGFIYFMKASAPGDVGQEREILEAEGAADKYSRYTKPQAEGQPQGGEAAARMKATTGN